MTSALVICNFFSFLSCRTQVSDESLHSIRCHDQGKLLACGSRTGDITLLELSNFLSTLQPNEKQNITTVSRPKLNAILCKIFIMWCKCQSHNHAIHYKTPNKKFSWKGPFLWMEINFMWYNIIFDRCLNAKHTERRFLRVDAVRWNWRPSSRVRPGELQEEGEGQQEGEEGELNKLHHNTQASSIPRPFSAFQWKAGNFLGTRLPTHLILVT